MALIHAVQTQGSIIVQEFKALYLSRKELLTVGNTVGTCQRLPIAHWAVVANSKTGIGGVLYRDLHE